MYLMNTSMASSAEASNGIDNQDLLTLNTNNIIVLIVFGLLCICSVFGCIFVFLMCKKYSKCCDCCCSICGDADENFLRNLSTNILNGSFFRSDTVQTARLDTHGTFYLP